MFFLYAFEVQSSHNVSGVLVSCHPDEHISISLHLQSNRTPVAIWDTTCTQERRWERKNRQVRSHLILFKLMAGWRCCHFVHYQSDFLSITPVDQLTMIVIIVAVVALTLSIAAIVSEYLSFFHLELCIPPC